MSWTPKRTHEEVAKILCAPGGLHELETRVIDGRVQRVYKNLWPSIRVFFLWAFQLHSNRTCVVYEDQRYTFAEIVDLSVKAASVFRTRYGISKGDRVAICSRNYPEYIVAFWAIHLLGGVSVLVNAWLPADPLFKCIVLTECKLVILDSQRADLLEPMTDKLRKAAGSRGFLVFPGEDGKGRWKGMELWKSVVPNHQVNKAKFLAEDPNCLPEDDATIFFTSGTTGTPKGVLGTHRMFLTNVPNCFIAGPRAILRRGEELPEPPKPNDPEKGFLISVPLFHVTGLTSHLMIATMNGMKAILIRKWVPEEVAKLIKAEGVTAAGGVPSMVVDIVEHLTNHPLETFAFGGAPAPKTLTTNTTAKIPTATLSQGYGLTETNSVVVSIAGEDYLTRPTVCGRATFVNDIVIMNDQGVSVAPGEVGEVWMRGPNIMKGYVRDQAATDKVITKDGFFKSGDLGYLDEEGYLYIKDRLKDIIIRGGENIDSVSVENALYADDAVLEAAAVAVPDERLGELVAAVVSVKRGKKVNEKSLIRTAAKTLPKHAVPVLVLVQNTPLEHTPSGKVIKQILRAQVTAEWKRRTARKAKL
ncbi:hypothetical protein C8J56DRAFT_971681 [Mycena floridula]|nr:hypothetical protein C8J56DRAFT_971681 [Mycena floridula]